MPNNAHLWYYSNQVLQNTGAIIEEGSFYSERHITCYNVIILNLSHPRAMMCHVNAIDTRILSPQQSETVEEFLHHPGNKAGLCIRGSQSRSAEPLKQFLTTKGVELCNDIEVNTKALTWNVHFRLLDRKLVVTDENEKIRYSGKPFPDLESPYAHFIIEMHRFQ